MCTWSQVLDCTTTKYVMQTNKNGTVSECSVQNSHVWNEILVLLHQAALGAADDSPGEVPCELFEPWGWRCTCALTRSRVECTRKNAHVACFVAVVTDLSRVSCCYVGRVYPVVLRRVCVPCVFPDKPAWRTNVLIGFTKTIFLFALSLVRLKK